VLLFVVRTVATGADPADAAAAAAAIAVAALSGGEEGDPDDGEAEVKTAVGGRPSKDAQEVSLLVDTLVGLALFT
jgi:hypothetical protein